MLKHLKKDKRIQVNLEMTAQEKRKLVAKAKRYTGGNISAWLRFAGLELEPDPKDLVG